MKRGRVLGPGRLEKVGKNWVLHWTDERGKRCRRALSTNQRTAERIRTDIIHRRDLARAGLGPDAGQELPVAEVCEQYLADLEPRVTRRHYQNVASGIRKVTSELNGTKVGELRQVDVVRIRSSAVAEGLAHRTANLRVDRLKAALTWAVLSEIISSNPLQHLRRLPENAEHRRYKRRAMTEDEIARFIAASEADDAECDEFLHDRRGTVKRIPQTPLWIALIETGGRWGEISRLPWGDVDLGNAVLVLRAEHTKSRKQRAIPLRAGLVDRLRNLRNTHAEVLGRLPTANDRVFLTPDGCAWPWHTTNAMRIFDRLLEAAGIPKLDVEGRKLDLHALRHTCATRLAKAGVRIAHAKEILGHSTVELTARVYQHLDVEDLRSAVDAMGQIAPEIETEPERRAASAR